MDFISNTPRNPLLGSLADTLLAGKTGANKYEIKPWVPLIGGTGLGDLFMGKAPELVDDTSYQGLKALYKGGNLATGGLGTYTPDKRILDTAMLGTDAYGVSKGLSSLGRAGFNKATSGVMNSSRRDFLKKLGTGAGAAALGATGLGVLRKIGKETGEHIADNVTTAPARKYKFNNLSEYYDDVYGRADFEATEKMHMDYPFYDELSEREYDNISERYTDEAMSKILEKDFKSYNKLKQDYKKYGRIRPNGEPIDIESLHAFSPQAKAEMKAYKLDNPNWLGK